MSYIGNEPIVSATRTVTEITATAGQTTFTANGGYTVGFIDVFVNGAQLQTSDFTATNGSTITLNSSASAGDDIRLVAYGTFNVANTYSVSQVDSKIGAAQFGFKNRIINGAMMIDQRNAGASVTATNGGYTLDRWVSYTSQTSKFTVQQNAGSVTPPTGFVKYLGVTSSSAYSVISSDYFAMSQIIEGYNIADLGWGTANAKTVTLSFWVYSSLTGTFGGSLSNIGRSYPFTYTISSANTWTQISITVAGDTSGTWATDNSAGLRVWFGLGAGATYSGTAGSWQSGDYRSATGATSVVGTNGATFYITGVQLEAGSTATSFDYRPYGTELALCQRYYWKWVASASRTYMVATAGLANTSFGPVKLPATMRTTPTLTTSGSASDYGGYAGSTYYVSTSVPVIDTSNYDTPLIGFTSSGVTNGTSGIFGSNSTNGFLGFNAEL